MPAFRPVRSDEPPADLLVAAMVAEIEGFYGPMDARNAPTATPEELWAPGGTYLVGVEDGRAVCGGGVKRLDDGLGEVKRMYVVESERGRGLARALLGALEDAARALGHRRLRLDTGPRQPHARALYEASGYAAIAAYNDNIAASFWGEKRLDLCAVEPARDPALAARLHAISRAAYEVEAKAVDHDGIPPLHESVEEFAASPGRWFARYDGATLVGALQFEDLGDAGVLVTRLVVDPAAHRRGHASALLEALPADRTVRVATATANAPALALYATHGFVTERDEEVAPGLSLRHLRRG